MAKGKKPETPVTVNGSKAKELITKKINSIDSGLDVIVKRCKQLPKEDRELMFKHLLESVRNASAKALDDTPETSKFSFDE